MFETIAHNIWGALSPPNPAQEHVFSLHNNYVFKLLLVFISNNPAFSTYRYRNSYKTETVTKKSVRNYLQQNQSFSQT